MTYYNNLKKRVVSSQQKAALNINKELILLYHEIGNSIILSQNKSSWGSKVIDKLSKDLQLVFPELKGFSTRNLKYMRKFTAEFDNFELVQQVVAQLPWGHIIVIMNILSDFDLRIFYVNKTIENGWSRSILNIQLGLYLRNLRSDAKLIFLDWKFINNLIIFFLCFSNTKLRIYF